MFTIEDNIAIPAKRAFGGGRASRYPVRDLEAGQSFFVPDTNGKRHAAAILAAAKTVRKMHPERRFVTRAVTENGVSGVRVWRVEDEGGDAPASAPAPARSGKRNGNAAASLV